MQPPFDRLKLPAIAAPMFLISGPDLVVEVCRCGTDRNLPRTQLPGQ